MRQFLLAILVALGLAVPASAQFTQAIGTHVLDAGNNILQSGTATFRVLDAGQHPMSVQLGGGGQVVTAPVTVPVNNGTFNAQVVDVSLTTPSFPCVQLVITDASGSVVWQNNCIQPTGLVWSLDNFSTNTTPVYPQAGSTVPGSLSVNGALNVTGALNVGSFNPGSVSAAQTNGVINATKFGGADIGAQVNAAFSFAGTTGTVFIPAGTYNFSTTIEVGNIQQHLVCDAGTTLNYTGTSGAAIELAKTQGVQGSTEIGVDGLGGCTLSGPGKTSSTIGILDDFSNSTYVTGMKIKGFGVGVDLAGANSARVYNNTISSNHVGIYDWNGPQNSAANAIFVTDNEISANDTGFANDHNAIAVATLGAPASQGGGNIPNLMVIEDNVFEGSTIGDISMTFVWHAVISKNYFESPAAHSINASYQGSFNITQNYFSDFTTGAQIYLGPMYGANISHNYEFGNWSSSVNAGGCFIDTTGQQTGVVLDDPLVPWTQGGSPTPHTYCVTGIPFNNAGGTKQILSNLHVAGALQPDQIACGSTAPPTVNVNAQGTGSDAQVTFLPGSCSNLGTIQVQTGAGGSFSGQVWLMTLTLPSGVGSSLSAPHALMLYITPVGSSANQINMYQGASSTTQVQVDGATALAPNSTYQFNYFIGQR